MKSRIVTVTAFTFLLIGMLTITFKIQPVKAEPTTLTVNDDGPADFSSIQEAINAASLGDIIYVYNGTYCENVVVNKTISLLGESQETTFIKGDGKGTVVDVVANDVKIFGFTIQNGYYGILLNVSSGIVIETNTITNNFFGVYARYSSNNSLSADRIIGNYYSIYLWYSEESNIVSNTLTNNTHGMELWFSGTIVIDDNFIIDNEHYGIYLYRSDSNVISENTFENNHEDPFGFDGYAVWLDRSNGNKVVSNIVVNNTDGIFMYDSKNNIVRRNTIATNQMRGVMLGGYLLSEHYYNNIICGNTIWSNKIGIDLYQYANYNRAYHNNFIDNEIQANVDEFTSDNIWDNGYPSGGNYWSDYSDTDLYFGPYQNITGSDGIGDTPYIIDENNQDDYPLMNPWTPTAPVITATIDINPDTLNLKSRGKWITCYIELPEGYSVSDIDRTTILLNGTIPVDPFWVDKPLGSVVGDYDDDGIPDLMVKFNRAVVIEYLLNQNKTHRNVTLTVTGEIYNGTPFESSDTIVVKMPSKGIAKIPNDGNSDNEYFTVMSEFPSLLILPLFMIATLVAVIVHRRRKHTM